MKNNCIIFELFIGIGQFRLLLVFFKIIVDKKMLKMLNSIKILEHLIQGSS